MATYHDPARLLRYWRDPGDCFLPVSARFGVKARILNGTMIRSSLFAA